MLVLSRHKDEQIWIGDVCVRVLEIRKGKVRLGIDAPKDVVVDRDEVRRRKDQQKRRSGESGE